jgi:hypothetical protein
MRETVIFSTEERIEGLFVPTIVFDDVVCCFKLDTCCITLVKGCNQIVPARVFSIRGFVHLRQRRIKDPSKRGKARFEISVAIVLVISIAVK